MRLDLGTEDWFEKTIALCRRDVETVAALDTSARLFRALLQKQKELDSDIRCGLHHAAVTTYARPFVGKRKYPVKELKKAPHFDREIHMQLLEIRNCLVAHIDEKYSTSRVLSKFAEGRIKTDEGLDIGLVIPTEIAALNIVIHEITDMKLCGRCLKHVETCLKKVLDVGHRHLNELRDEWIKNPQLGRGTSSEADTGPIDATCLENRISLPDIDLSAHHLSEIPKPELITGHDGYKYRRVTLFARYKEWELIIERR